MRLLIVAESMPSRHAHHGEGSSLITWELLRRVPEGVEVRLAYFRTTSEPAPDALLRVCPTVHELPARSGVRRFGYLASAAPSAAWAYSASSARKQVAALAADADVVLLHGLRCGLLASDLPVPFVLNEIDPAGYDLKERVASSRGLKKAFSALNLRRTLRLERRLAGAAAAWIVVSETDARLLERTLQRPVLAIPNGVELPAGPAAVRRAGEGPPTLCFMGTLDWPPNELSVDRLTTVVMPRLLRQVPDARLLVAGRRPSDKVRMCLSALGTRAELLEDFASVDDVFAKVDVMVFPDQEGGGGVRNSALETIVRGVPLVATPAALRGIDVLTPLGLPANSEDDLTTFVNAIARLLTDPAALVESRQHVREVGSRLSTWDTCAQRYFEVLLGVASGRRLTVNDNGPGGR